MSGDLELAPGVRWADLCDDPDHLAVAALDLRLSWAEPEDPWAIAAWRKWHALARWHRDLPALREGLRALMPPPAAVGLRPHLSDALEAVA